MDFEGRSTFMTSYVTHMFYVLLRMQTSFVGFVGHISLRVVCFARSKAWLFF